MIGFPVGVEEVNAGGIGAEAVEDEVGGSAAGSGASDLVHGDRGIASIASVGDVVAGDFVGLGADGEEGVGSFAADFDKDFVGGAEGVGGSRVGEVEGVEMEGGRLAVVEDGLIGQGDLKDVAEDEGGHAGAEAAGDMKGEDEAQDVVGAVNAGEVDAGGVG